MKVISICFVLMFFACGRSGSIFHRRSQSLAEIDSGNSSIKTPETPKNSGSFAKPAIHPNDGVVVPRDDIFYDQFEASLNLTESELFHLSSLTSFSNSELQGFRQKSNHEVRVLQLNYFPVRPDGSLDYQETASPEDWTLNSLRARVAETTIRTATGLSNSTNPEGKGTPYLSYKVIETKEFNKKIPVRRSTATDANFPDHEKVLQQDVSICDYVDNLGVRDVWIFMYHRDKDVVPIESNMSMGTVSSQYFNYGGFGDISNSYREDDLPQCVNTYVVYEFNFNAGPAENLHNYGHQREAVFRHLGYQVWTLDFVRPYGYFSNSERVINHCGDVHHPFNATHDYDYKNRSAILTHCNFWLKDLNDYFRYENRDCSTWNCDHHDWLVWWAQRIPSFANNLIFNARPLRNFHEFFADFDLALALGSTLYNLQGMGDASAVDTTSRQVTCPAGLPIKCQVLLPLGKQTSGPCGYQSEDKNTGDRNRQLLPDQESLSFCIERQTALIQDLLSVYSEREFFVEFYGEQILKLSAN